MRLTGDGTTRLNGGEAVSRRVTPLTAGLVPGLPGGCGQCVFWEHAGVCPKQTDDAATSGSDGDAVRKQAWVSARVQAGEGAGRAVLVDGEVAAYALFAPAHTFPRRSSTVPDASPDALQLATAHVAAEHRGWGIGRLLVHTAAQQAVRDRHTAVEVYGDRWFGDTRCMLPAAWLLREGFEIHREHPRTPLLRLEVRRTVRWAESIEHAFEDLLGRVPPLLPEPSRAVGDAPR